MNDEYGTIRQSQQLGNDNKAFGYGFAIVTLMSKLFRVTVCVGLIKRASAFTYYDWTSKQGK